METGENDDIMKDLGNYSLWLHKTFGIEAHCRRFLEFVSVEEAQQVAKILRASDTSYIIIVVALKRRIFTLCMQIYGIIFDFYVYSS